MIPIKYVGLKARRADTVANTQLVWESGQTHMVPPEAAAKLLKHPDIWALDGDTPFDAALMPAKRRELSIREEQDEVSSLKVGVPSIGSMTKAQLLDFAQTRYGQALPKDLKVADMRARIVSLENSGQVRDD